MDCVKFLLCVILLLNSLRSVASRSYLPHRLEVTEEEPASAFSSFKQLVKPVVTTVTNRRHRKVFKNLFEHFFLAGTYNLLERGYHYLRNCPDDDADCDGKPDRVATRSESETEETRRMLKELYIMVREMRDERLRKARTSGGANYVGGKV